MRLLVSLEDPAARRAALAALGGIAVVRRVVRLAERAGLHDVVVRTGEDDEATRRALAGTCAVVGRGPGGGEDVLLLDAAFVPSQAWLEEVAAQTSAATVFGDGAAAIRGSVALATRPVLTAAGLSAAGAAVAPAPGGAWVRDEAERRDLERRLIRGLVKDTEGFMSRHVERPISLAISRRLMATSVTPNQMTWFSLAVGLVGAACLAQPGRAWGVAGALLFLAHSILDGCDGELARLRLQESRWGGVLDFWGDNVVHAAVFLGIGVAWHRTDAGVLPLACAAAAILGTFVSAFLVYRHTMRAPAASGPLYQSVSRASEKSRTARVADALSRRDFIYLVVLLACLGHLEVFLVLSAIGAPAFAATLLLIRRAERSPAASA